MYRKNLKTEGNEMETNERMTVRMKSRRVIFALLIALAAATVTGTGCGSVASSTSSGSSQTASAKILPDPELSTANRQVASTVVHIVDEYLSGDLFPVQAVSKLNDAYLDVQPAEDSRSEKITKELNNDIIKIKNEVQKEEILNYVVNDTGGCDVSALKKYRNDICKIADINF